MNTTLDMAVTVPFFLPLPTQGQDSASTTFPLVRHFSFFVKEGQTD